jgi:hypothetical protein
LGGIIVDLNVRIGFKGPISEFVKVLGEFEAMQKRKGSVMIDTVPLPDRPELKTLVIQESGLPISELEETVTQVLMLRKKLEEMGLWVDPTTLPPRHKGAAPFVEMTIRARSE